VSAARSGELAGPQRRLLLAAPLDPALIELGAMAAHQSGSMASALEKFSGRGQMPAHFLVAFGIAANKPNSRQPRRSVRQQARSSAKGLGPVAKRMKSSARRFLGLPFGMPNTSS